MARCRHCRGNGKLSHIFTDLDTLQNLYGAPGRISVIWVKVDDPTIVDSVVADLEKKLTDYHVYSMEKMISLLVLRQHTDPQKSSRTL